MFLILTSFFYSFNFFLNSNPQSGLELRKKIEMIITICLKHRNETLIQETNRMSSDKPVSGGKRSRKEDISHEQETSSSEVVGGSFMEKRARFDPLNVLANVSAEAVRIPSAEASAGSSSSAPEATTESSSSSSAGSSSSSSAAPAVASAAPAVHAPAIAVARVAETHTHPVTFNPIMFTMTDYEFNLLKTKLVNFRLLIRGLLNDTVHSLVKTYNNFEKISVEEQAAVFEFSRKNLLSIFSEVNYWKPIFSRMKYLKHGSHISGLSQIGIMCNPEDLKDRPKFSLQFSYMIFGIRTGSILLFINELIIILNYSLDAFTHKLEEAREIGKEGLKSFIKFIYDYVRRMQDSLIITNYDLENFF